MKLVKKKAKLVIFQDWIFFKSQFLESKDQEWGVIYIFLKMKSDRIIQWIRWVNRLITNKKFHKLFTMDLERLGTIMCHNLHFKEVWELPILIIQD